MISLSNGYRKVGCSYSIFLRLHFASCSAGRDHKRAGVATGEIGAEDHTTNETELHTIRRVESAGTKTCDKKILSASWFVNAETY